MGSNYCEELLPIKVMNGSGRHILVVDDEPINNKILAEYLKKYEATVCISLSAGQAIKEMEKCRFDCIITDFSMPHMTGADLTRIVRQTNLTIPILILTAHNIDEVRGECLAAGANWFLIKPIYPGTLYQILAKIGI